MRKTKRDCYSLFGDLSDRLEKSRRTLLGLLLVLCMFTPTMEAQGVFGTLTGIVSDPSGAVVPNASVKLRDAGSGSERTTVTDNQGYYTFASVPVGTYILTVELAGFQGYKAPE